MADNEKEVGEGTTPRGADWEVVTLTASAYEAAPGPDGTEVKPINEDQERSSSNELLRSDHFVFPPGEHENLPIQTSFDEIQPEKDVQKPSTSVEDHSVKNDAGSERVQFDDEGKHLSDDDVEMRDDTPGYGSFHSEDDAHGFVSHDDGNESGEDFDDKSGHPSEPADSKSCDTGASCKCWLKKHMTCLYNQAKETNAIWTVVVAAALVGIVILGRWHKDKLHLNQLKWRSGSAVRSPTSVSSFASWAGDGEEEAVKSKAMHPLLYRSERVGVGCGSVVWELSRCASQFLVFVTWRKDACSGLAAG